MCLNKTKHITERLVMKRYWKTIQTFALFTLRLWLVRLHYCGQLNKSNKVSHFAVLHVSTPSEKLEGLLRDNKYIFLV